MGRNHKDFPDWYRTQSIQRAAFLVAKGADLPRLDGKRGHAIFYFHDPNGELAWEAMKFDNDEQVGIKMLFASWKRLRDGMEDFFAEQK